MIQCKKKHKWAHVGNFMDVRISRTSQVIRKKGHYECTLCGAKKIGNYAATETKAPAIEDHENGK